MLTQEEIKKYNLTPLQTRKLERYEKALANCKSEEEVDKLRADFDKSTAWGDFFATADNSATLGLLPKIAGWVSRYGRDYLATVANSTASWNRYSRADFDNRTDEQKDEDEKLTRQKCVDMVDHYSQDHPALSVVANLAGSLPLGAAGKGIQTLRALGAAGKGIQVGSKTAQAGKFAQAGKAAATGALWGAGYSAGDAISRDKTLGEGTLDTLKGAALGAAIGGGINRLGNTDLACAGKKVLNDIRRPFSKKMKAKQTIENIGKEDIGKSIENGVALVETNSNAVQQELKDITHASPKTMKAAKDIYTKEATEQDSKINEKFIKMFGSDTEEQFRNKRDEGLNKACSYLYDKAYKNNNLQFGDKAKVDALLTRRQVLKNSIKSKQKELDRAYDSINQQELENFQNELSALNEELEKDMASDQNDMVNDHNDNDS